MVHLGSELSILWSENHQKIQSLPNDYPVINLLNDYTCYKSISYFGTVYKVNLIISIVYKFIKFK